MKQNKTTKAHLERVVGVLGFVWFGIFLLLLQNITSRLLEIQEGTKTNFLYPLPFHILLVPSDSQRFKCLTILLLQFEL